MNVQRFDISLTSAAGGGATGYTSAPITGRALSVLYDKGTLATTADITLTGAVTGVAILTASPAADAVYHPRHGVHTAAGASATAAALEPAVLAREKVKVVLAQGGNAKSGTVTVVVG